jgi:hypothetical protein
MYRSRGGLQLSQGTRLGLRKRFSSSSDHGDPDKVIRAREANQTVILEREIDKTR